MISKNVNGILVRETLEEGSNRVANLGNHTAANTITIDPASATLFPADVYMVEVSGDFNIIVNMLTCPIGTTVTFLITLDNAGAGVTIQENGVAVATRSLVAGVVTTQAFAAFAAPSTAGGADVPAQFTAGEVLNAGGTAASQFQITLQKFAAPLTAGARDGWLLREFFRVSNGV